MKELTKAEEQIMQILWELEHAFVKDVVEKFPDPKPAYNTVSTIIRILQEKGFVSYEAFGKSHRYYPLVSKKEYTHKYLKNFVNNYFDRSFTNLVSFFTREEKIDIQELEEILQRVRHTQENGKPQSDEL